MEGGVLKTAFNSMLTTESSLRSSQLDYIFRLEWLRITRTTQSLEENHPRNMSELIADTLAIPPCASVTPWCHSAGGSWSSPASWDSNASTFQNSDCPH
jgi:hypothetical protein